MDTFVIVILLIVIALLIITLRSKLLRTHWTAGRRVRRLGRQLNKSCFRYKQPRGRNRRGKLARVSEPPKTPIEQAIQDPAAQQTISGQPPASTPPVPGPTSPSSPTPSSSSRPEPVGAFTTSRQFGPGTEASAATTSRRPPLHPHRLLGFFRTTSRSGKIYRGEPHQRKIGIAILVLAIGFFVKYAIDNDWVGPVGRVEYRPLMRGILVGIAHWHGTATRKTTPYWLAAGWRFLFYDRARLSPVSFVRSNGFLYHRAPSITVLP